MRKGPGQESRRAPARAQAQVWQETGAESPVPYVAAGALGGPDGGGPAPGRCQRRWCGLRGAALASCPLFIVRFGLRTADRAHT